MVILSKKLQCRWSNYFPYNYQGNTGSWRREREKDFPSVLLSFSIRTTSRQQHLHVSLCLWIHPWLSFGLPQNHPSLFHLTVCGVRCRLRFYSCLFLFSCFLLFLLMIHSSHRWWQSQDQDPQPVLVADDHQYQVWFFLPSISFRDHKRANAIHLVTPFLRSAAFHAFFSLSFLLPLFFSFRFIIRSPSLFSCVCCSSVAWFSNFRFRKLYFVVPVC